MISRQCGFGTDEGVAARDVLTGSVRVKTGPEQQQEGALARTVAALERGASEEADRIATMALLDEGDNEDLWMAAGLARLARGRARAARDAFLMCAWLAGDPTARELARLLSGLEGQPSSTQTHSRS